MVEPESQRRHSDGQRHRLERDTSLDPFLLPACLHSSASNGLNLPEAEGPGNADPATQLTDKSGKRI